MTRRDLALHLLREAGDRGITTAEFLQAGVGSRYSARIMELRQAGHVIEAERIREGSWKYVLTRDAASGADVEVETNPTRCLVSATQGAPPPTHEPAGDHPPGAPAGSTLFELPGRPREAALHDFEADEAA